jgi:hypothetical protein
MDSNIYPGNGKEILEDFDNIVIIPPEFCRTFDKESDTLVKITFRTFPCFGIELNDDLTAAQFQHRVAVKSKYRLQLLNWDRKIHVSPLI